MKRHISPILLIGVIAVALYANTLKNGFVYDDEFTITTNTFIKDLANLPKLFDKVDYFLYSGEETYRPVVTFSYFMDYALYGLKPLGYHLTNVLLHAANSILLYIFLVLLLEPPVVYRASTALSRFFSNAPLLTSIMFVTHPALTEAVNSVSYREDLLTFFFYVGALNIYLFLRSYITAFGKFLFYLLYVLSFVLYFLALFSKEMAVTFPLAVYCYEWIYVNKEKNQTASNLFSRMRIGYIVITFVYLYLRFHYFQNPIEWERPEWRMTERIFTIPWLLTNNLKLTLFPFSLSADYVIFPVSSIFSYSFIVPFFIVFSAVTTVLTKGNRNLFFGILFFIMSLLPVFNIFPIAHPLAERYLYLPIIGATIIVWVVINNCTSSSKIGLSFLYIFVYCFFILNNSVVVINRNGIWNNNYLLWTDAIKKFPDSNTAHFNLGFAYDNQGQLEKAIQEYQIALRLSPYDVEAHNNLANVYIRQRRFEEAIQEYLAALKLKPNYPDAHFNLGVAYGMKGLTDKARDEFEITLKLRPNDLQTRRALEDLTERAECLFRSC